MKSAKAEIKILALGVAVFFVLLGTAVLCFNWKIIVEGEIENYTLFTDEALEKIVDSGLESLDETMVSIIPATPVEEAFDSYLYVVVDSLETVVSPPGLKGLSLGDTRLKKWRDISTEAGGWEARIWDRNYDVLSRQIPDSGLKLYALYCWTYIYDSSRDALLKIAFSLLVLLLVVLFSVFFVVIPIVSRITKRQHDAEAELDIARDVQLKALPGPLPAIPGCEVHAFLKTMKEVGGDLYNWGVCGDWLYFLVGDVSGKGMEAAFMMVMLNSTTTSCINEGRSPEKILDIANSTFLEPAGRFGDFCTMFVGRINLLTREFQYSNAGHNRTLVGREFLDQDPGLPLGLDAAQKYTLQSIVLPENTVIMQYTDGLTEARRADGDFYGTGRLLAWARKADFAPDAEQITDSLISDADSFLSGLNACDDVAILTIKI